MNIFFKNILKSFRITLIKDLRIFSKKYEKY